MSFDSEAAVATFEPEAPLKEAEELVFIGFARVFAGTLRVGQELWVLPDGGGEREATRVGVGRLYLLMGRDLEEVEAVPAGSVVGIGGLGNAVLRHATLSTTKDMAPFYPVKASAEPIVRVSVEPERSGGLPALLKGLRLLRQADPCVRTAVDDAGAAVIVAAGEVHLARCLDDLRTRFAPGVGELRVSPPIIPFQETIVLRPKTDRAQELIQYKPLKEDQGTEVEVRAAGGSLTLRMEAFPLPEAVVKVLDKFAELLDTIDRSKKGQTERQAPAPAPEPSEGLQARLAEFQDELTLALVDAWKELRGNSRSIWPRFTSSDEVGALVREQLWAFGPRKARLNLLFNGVPGYGRPSRWRQLGGEEGQEGELREGDKSIHSGFHLGVSAGPLCEEPVRGVAFILTHWEQDETVGNVIPFLSEDSIQGQDSRWTGSTGS